MLFPLFLVLTILGCAAAPRGPAFEWAAEPSDRRGRIYLYRADPLPSLAVVKTSIDGRTTGTLRDGEYTTLELAAGSHQLRVGMRGMGFFTLGWNAHNLRVRPGETLFFQLEVRIDEGTQSQLDTPRSLEIGGRSDYRVSENVFIREQTRADATPALETSTRLTKPN